MESYVEVILPIVIGGWVAWMIYKWIYIPIMNEILAADKPPINRRYGTETGRYTTDRSLITEVCRYCKRVKCGCGGKDE